MADDSNEKDRSKAGFFESLYSPWPLTPEEALGDELRRRRKKKKSDKEDN